MLRILMTPFNDLPLGRGGGKLHCEMEQNVTLVHSNFGCFNLRLLDALVLDGFEAGTHASYQKNFKSEAVRL